MPIRLPRDEEASFGKGRLRLPTLGTTKFNCPFENETVLYDATDLHPNLDTDPVGPPRPHGGDGAPELVTSGGFFLRQL
jgi:hypothetical protein